MTATPVTPRLVMSSAMAAPAGVGRRGAPEQARVVVGRVGDVDVGERGAGRRGGDQQRARVVLERGKDGLRVRRRGRADDGRHPEILDQVLAAATAASFRLSASKSLFSSMVQKTMPKCLPSIPSASLASVGELRRALARLVRREGAVHQVADHDGVRVARRGREEILGEGLGAARVLGGRRQRPSSPQTEPKPNASWQEP